VTYDRGRTEGLTDADIIGALTASYGEPVPGRAGVQPAGPVEALPGAVVIARWEKPSASMTLVRANYGPEFQLIVVSTPLSTRAATAVRDALKLDVLDAPRRESEQRNRDAAEATAEREKARVINKGAFRP
jgi:hypothetical protein